MQKHGLLNIMTIGFYKNNKVIENRSIVPIKPVSFSICEDLDSSFLIESILKPDQSMYLILKNNAKF
ncbi:hypothetical protein [Zobellia roscoffensis]|uniref:hypothetical protein n=1 Tax=Zobellia roscoffensis TaxID=2779508 RepID=UPI001D03D8E7|nr:hypothetical protein [Zobellia roscoffensis]